MSALLDKLATGIVPRYILERVQAVQRRSMRKLQLSGTNATACMARRLTIRLVQPIPKPVNASSERGMGKPDLSNLVVHKRAASDLRSPTESRSEKVYRSFLSYSVTLLREKFTPK